MATKKNGSVADVVTSLAAPLAEQLGYSLWDVEYVREGADYYLRITIDSEEGITIEVHLQPVPSRHELYWPPP